MVKKMADSTKKGAMQLIILFGVVSLFGDIVYEGARSVNGQYLKTLGADAALVGLIAGIGEFVGYAIRLFSGYLSDKTKSYWFFTFLGYGLLCSIPLLAFTSIWQMAAVYIVLERLGKAMRSPAKDTIISQAAKQVGTGFGFGIHEAMDQIGAIAGPLFFSLVFLLKGDYKTGYAVLWIPFALVMLSILWAYIRFPSPEKFEKSSKSKVKIESDRLSKVFWIYNLFTFLSVMGFANFAILGYHFKTVKVLTDAQIPLFYAIAMGVDAIIALIIGRLYDKFGLTMLFTIPLFSLSIPVFGFSNNAIFVIIAIILWGAAMGVHETIMRAAIADLTNLKKRGTGYGIFNTTYGLAWLFGSSIMGYLYSIKILWVIIFSVGIEFLSIPFFLWLRMEAFYQRK